LSKKGGDKYKESKNKPATSPSQNLLNTTTKKTKSNTETGSGNITETQIKNKKEIILFFIFLNKHI